MGVLKLLQAALTDAGSLDECKGCGSPVNPAARTCPDCIEENRQALQED